MTEPEDRALLIKKLLRKAEAVGTTPEEAAAFTAKAEALMIKWGVEEAMLQDADRTQREQIVKRIFVPDCPKTYSHEFTMIGVAIADAFGVRPVLGLKQGKTYLIAVGFASDVMRVGELFASLALQCTVQLGPWYTKNVREWWTGTDKYRAKRGFVSGFARGVGDKLKAIRQQVVASAEPGTDLVLVDRSAQIGAWVNANMQLRNGRGRSQDAGASGAGWGAGQRANVGQSTVGNSAGRAVTR